MRINPVKNRCPVLCLPLFNDRVPAGFPSPAADYIDKAIDLNTLLIAHPAATYFVRVTGDSMTGAGIYEGSLLLVDSSIRAQHNDIVIASVDGEFTVKRLCMHPVRELRAENPDYAPIAVREGEALEIFGVVKFVINEV